MTTQITITPEQQSLPPAQLRAPQPPQLVNDEFFGSFADMLDVVNPLQQIPGVSTIYRALTGETISTGARLAGGALFGGPVGFAVAMLSSIVQDISGKDLGETALALFDDEPASSSELAARAYEQTNQLL